ncbi:MAG: anaerobic sulfatase maturase [Muribaculaceae bacterium]
MEIDFLTAEAEINRGRKHFHLMVKPIGAVCNLHCTYCYYLEKSNLYPKPQSECRMSDEVLKLYIKNYISSQPTENHRVVFAWQGGEPTLLGVEFFERAVELQRQYSDGRQIENTLQTNGMLIDERWAVFFKEHKFLIGISIDGPQDLHDAYRRTQSGVGSWKRVMKSIDLLKIHGVKFNTLTVVNSLNGDHPLRVYNFLKSIGSDWMQFIPIQERKSADKNQLLRLVANDYTEETTVTKESVQPEQWGNFLITIFDQWVRNDVGSVFIKQFDCALEAWCGYNPTACTQSRYCGEGLVMEHNGDVYSCDHFVYPQFKLGNIKEQPLQEMASSVSQTKFGKDKRQTLSVQCQNCKYLAACNGECPKHRFTTNDAGEKIAYLCRGYYNFYDHAAPFLHAMRTLIKQGGKASSIMNFLAIDN